MRKFVATMAGLLALAGTPAMAADLPTNADQGYMAPHAKTGTPFDWSGLYFGVAAGGGNDQSRIFNDSGNYSGYGFVAGGTLGWNWQVHGSPILLGVEGDFSWANIEARQSFSGFPGCSPDCVTHANWLATARGRLGVVNGSFLVYGTGGIAWANFNWGQPDFPFYPSVTQTGFVVGGGIEGMLHADWSWKAEYLYVGFEKDTSLAFGGCPTGACGDYNRMQIIRLGLNKHF